MKYRIHAKNAGDADPIEFDFPRGFKFDGQLLRPLNQGGEPSSLGALYLPNVAAILPESFGETQFSGEFFTFNVFIKRRKEPLKVIAQAFDIPETEPSVRFYSLSFDGSTTNIQKRDIPNVYVAVSEVVLVVPSKGLPAGTWV